MAKENKNTGLAKAGQVLDFNGNPVNIDTILVVKTDIISDGETATGCFSIGGEQFASITGTILTALEWLGRDFMKKSAKKHRLYFIDDDGDLSAIDLNTPSLKMFNEFQFVLKKKKLACHQIKSIINATEVKSPENLNAFVKLAFKATEQAGYEIPVEKLADIQDAMGMDIAKLIEMNK